MLLAKTELKIIIVLSTIFALRMFGMALVIPTFSLSAQSYSNATAELIGLAVGGYGLAQAGLQLPFGMLSDKFGRRAIIVLGLLFMMLGSLICYQAESIYAVICGRCLQGAAAIGSVSIACLLDHIEPARRSIAMACLGIAIGLAFVLAMVLGPYLSSNWGLSGVFLLTAGLALCGIALSLIFIPKSGARREAIPMPSWSLSCMPMYAGVFVLHASLAALFLVLPQQIAAIGFEQQRLWQLYAMCLLPAMASAFWLMRRTELLLVGLFGLAQLLLLVVVSKQGLVVGLVLYFAAFCSLEAILPTSLAARAAQSKRGATMGVYSTLQFLGVFIGGILGGWLLARVGVYGVFALVIALTGVWLGLSWYFNRELKGELSYG